MSFAYIAVVRLLRKRVATMTTFVFLFVLGLIVFGLLFGFLWACERV